jgi:cell division septal protein FtsQ
MRPERPTAGEFRVIRWLFTALAVVALLYLGYSWFSQVRACDQACAVAGQGDGQVRFHGGGRFMSGTHCGCVNATR